MFRLLILRYRLARRERRHAQLESWLAAYREAHAASERELQWLRAQVSRCEMRVKLS